MSPLLHYGLPVHQTADEFDRKPWPYSGTQPVSYSALGSAQTFVDSSEQGSAGLVDVRSAPSRGPRSDCLSRFCPHSGCSYVAGIDDRLISEQELAGGMTTVLGMTGAATATAASPQSFTRA